MSATFDPDRSDAIRVMLVDQARPAPRRRRRTLGAVALVIAGAVGGAALSTAALAATGQLATASGLPSGQPTPTLPDAIDAPAGTLPGSPVTVLLGTSTTLPITEATTFPLADRPEGATHVRVYVTPQAGGGIKFGTDAGGNNPYATWNSDDVGTDSAMWDDLPLDSTTDTLYLTPYSGFTGIATIQFITAVPTHLATNANGDTYGVEGGPDGTPDLVSVWATAPDGSMVEGYVRTVELNAFSPDHPGQPTSPAQAGEWQEERGNAYPNGWDIPAFAEDGVTQVGTFHVG